MLIKRAEITSSCFDFPAENHKAGLEDRANRRNEPVMRLKKDSFLMEGSNKVREWEGSTESEGVGKGRG